MYKNITINRFIILVLVVVLSVFSMDVVGQNRGAKIIDISSNSSNKVLEDYVILDVDSSQKGFILPRMTTTERNAITINKQTDQGLVIYNITTECVEYYNTNIDMWVSLCGETLPADITILPSQCSAVKVIGEYYQNSELTNKNGIIISVTTSKAGAYHIIALSNNGYSFEAKGNFPTTGTYPVFLKGDGKPVRGYNVGTNGESLEQGDKLSLIVNNKPKGCDVFVFVNKDMPMYNITSTIVNGRYFTSENVTAQETITVNVNVDRVGHWIMKTDASSGVLFSGEGVFTTAGNQTVILKSIGRTTVKGQNDIVIQTNSLIALGEAVKSFKTSYKGEGPTFNLVNCQAAKFSNTIYTGELIPLGTTLKVFVKALAPGKNITIRSGYTAVSGNGSSTTVWFKSNPIDLVYDRNAVGVNANVQEVTLTVLDSNRNHAAIVPEKREMFFIQEEGYNANECTTPAKIEMDIINRFITTIKFESPFSSTESPGTKFVPPYTDMSKMANKVYLDVAFSAANASSGTVNVVTNQVNGITFTGNLPVVNHIAQGKLYATGIAEKAMSNVDSKFTITRTDTNDVVGDINVDFVYRRMSLLSYGNNVLFITDKTNNNGSTYPIDMMLNKELFGWNGVVRVDGFNYIDATGAKRGEIGTSGTIASFETDLDKADIVSVTGLLAKSQPKLDALYSKLSTKKFALIYTERYDASLSGGSPINYYTNFIYFVKKFDNSFSGITGVSNMYAYSINNISGAQFEKLYDNRFLAKYPSGSKTDIKTTSFGFSESSSADSGNHSFSFNSIPSGFKALYKNGVNTYGIINDQMGVILIGNYRPLHGVSGGTSYHSPIEINSNNQPRATTTYGSSSTNLMEVYNAYHFLNIMHWSIDYAQKNRIP